MGGRGFPYCTIINADGEVIWEVRPTSEEVVMKGFADAKMLQGLIEKSKAAPDDKGLKASVALMSALGKGQREVGDFAKLDEYAKTEGIDAKVKARFDEWSVGKRFETEFMAAARGSASRDEAYGKVYKMYTGGKRAPKGHNYEFAFLMYAGLGAAGAKDLEAANSILTSVKKMAEGNPRMQRGVDDLTKAIDEAKGGN